ncbi:hypothetical protein PPYR_08482 [Photinus pyralis]|uniref:Uncharacterized protein n=1 Tax=Photinus pyralis TaxID=7054 RepID=A0A5N4AJK2_PHOPY|nr:uncharacterized protein LOC116172159 [Photinus pyralis]KAB0797489.1 hypothetical protein PPYR_08482 [Photinus pyralis]
MYRINFMLIIVIVICTMRGESDINRVKRALLVAPMGGVFKLVIGVAIPIHLGLKQSMVYGLNFQFQYAQPQNVSQLKVYPPIISRKREKREEMFNDRAVAYAALESLMDRYYKIDGRACLLRSICENAMQSLHSEENGVYGKIMHVLLTPNYGNRGINSGLNPLYLEAFTAGKYGVDCISLYPSCPYGHGILDIITTLAES